MKSILKNPGKLAGLSIVLMALAAAFAYGYVWPQFGNGSSALPWEDQQKNALLLFQAAGAWFVIGVLDLVASAALCLFYENQNRKLSTISASARIIYTVFLFIGVFKLYQGLDALKLSNGAEELANAMDAFEHYWSIGLVVFGIHLLGLAKLAIKPKWLKFLLYVAGASYVLIHFGYSFTPQFNTQLESLEAVLGTPMGLAEILFAVFLLYKPETLMRQ